MRPPAAARAIRPLAAAATTIALVAALVATVPPPAAADVACPDTDQLEVPGAEYQQVVCLEDLTTRSNPRTDTGASTGAGTRESGSLHSAHTRHPDQPVPGLQIEGWFPDSCDHYQAETNTFMPACDGGTRHNGQFVIRIPNHWDGVHLVVGGTPGIRTQFASDIVLSDQVLARGWAYVSQDKGNTGLNFFRAGDDETDGSRTSWIPARAIEQWATMMAHAADAAVGALEQTHGRAPTLTYAAGISNGGYQTRLALERYPDRFDGGVDWEGTLFTAEGPNLFTYIPPILQAYPAYRAGDAAAYQQLVHEGRLPPDSEPVWEHHYSIYYGTVQSTYRPVVDPEYTNGMAAPRLIVPPGDPDAHYDYHDRPPFVAERMQELANTGDTHGKPLITLHGTLDALLPISTDSDVYAEMVRGHGHGDAFRYYVIEGGTHVDPKADEHPEVFRPILPCFLDALDHLDAWVASGTAPPPSGFVPFPADATEEERANTCALPEPSGRIAGTDRVETAIAASRATFGITPTVVLAAADRFPDALAAAPLAAAHDAPVLLVRDELTEALQRELHRLGAIEAIIVGGTAAVPEPVAAALTEGGIAVERVAGADRYETAAAVARALGGSPAEAVVVSGEAFADALSAAPLAAAAGIPILLTPRAELHPATAAALRELEVDRTLVIGGRAAVTDAVTGRLPRPTRIAGADRYETSVAVAHVAVQRGHDLEEVYVATGRDFADALAAGPVATAGEWGAVPGGVVLFVDGAAGGRGPATEFLTSVSGQVRRVLLFGGPRAIDPAVERALRRAVAGEVGS